MHSSQSACFRINHVIVIMSIIEDFYVRDLAQSRTFIVIADLLMRMRALEQDGTYHAQHFGCSGSGLSLRQPGND